MNIQSSGRLGNILFIWAHAIRIRNKSGASPIVIFADKFHSADIEDLIETLEMLEVNGINFKVDNRLGLLLQGIDKVATFAPQLAYFLRKLLRIQTEGVDLLTADAWIQRGYFQEELIHLESETEIVEKLEWVIHKKIQDSFMLERMPFLRDEYQAIHIRLTDFVGSNSGVIDPNSQLESLQDNLQVIICTDGSREDLSKRMEISNYQVITPNETSAWETIAILSGAKNLVTTNSTLSWWSGYLASHQGKEVWIPMRWSKEKPGMKPISRNKQRVYSPVFE